MRNNKKYIAIPIVVFVFSFLLLRGIGVSYSASNSEYNYFYIRRNMLSHHFISSNGGNASGTILIKTGERKSDSGDPTLVYCAKQGQDIHGNKGYSKENLSSAGYSTETQNKLRAILTNSYPYITIDQLKQNLKSSLTGIGNQVYVENLFDTLDVQEAMTATQAAIWNIVGGTDVFKYGTTKKINSPYYLYFGEINWDECSSYNIQGRGSRSTILETGETAESVCGYKKKGTDKLESRINSLINWYMNLKTTTTYTDDVTSFRKSGESWSTSNNLNQLSVNIMAYGDFDYTSSNYNIIFYDLNGNVVNDSNITKTPITVSGVIKGYNYVIDSLTTDGVTATVTASKTGMPTNVYYYRPKENGTQAFVGVDEGTINITNTLTFINDVKQEYGEVVVYKVKNNVTNVTTSSTALGTLCTTNDNNTCLDGAYFALYASDKKTVVEEFISSSKEAETISDLPVGTYYLKELNPPIGYLLNEEYIKIEVLKDQITTAIVNNDPTKICIKKVSSTDKTLLDGGTFRIENAEGGTYEEFHASTDSNGYCITGQLESGYYYLVEEAAPDNYVKANILYKFKVGKFDPESVSGELAESDTVVLVNDVNNVITIENDPIDEVVISKSDLTTGKCLAGATLVVKNSNNQVIDTWISTCENGKDTHQIKLAAGTYTLTETNTPKGYATAETITFIVDANGKVNKSLNMKDAPIKVSILKTSTDVDEGLPGAEFEIYNEDGSLYDTFTSGYLATDFDYMPIGTYTIKEIKAPDGYKISNEITKITVKNTAERQLFVIQNEVDVPKTSLDYSQVTVIIATIFMMFGIGLVGYYGYKKQI